MAQRLKGRYKMDFEDFLLSFIEQVQPGDIDKIVPLLILNQLICADDLLDMPNDWLIHFFIPPLKWYQNVGDSTEYAVGSCLAYGFGFAELAMLTRRIFSCVVVGDLRLGFQLFFRPFE